MFLKYRKPTIAWVVFLLLCGGVVFASFQGKMERYYGISTDGSVATLPAGTIITSPVTTGGSIDSTPIGATTPATGAFTTLASSTSFQCDSTSGTVLRGIYIGTDTFDNGSTTTATTISGVLPGDVATVTFVSGNTNGVAMKTTVCTTNTVTSVYGDPGAESTVIVQVTGY